MNSFISGKIFIEGLWVPGTTDGSHDFLPPGFMGGPRQRVRAQYSITHAIIYINLAVICVMSNKRYSLRIHLQKQLLELWQQPDATHHACHGTSCVLTEK